MWMRAISAVITYAVCSPGCGDCGASGVSGVGGVGGAGVVTFGREGGTLFGLWWVPGRGMSLRGIWQSARFHPTDTYPYGGTPGRRWGPDCAGRLLF